MKIITENFDVRNAAAFETYPLWVSEEPAEL